MALNPFFLQGSSGEQNLVQSLINEQIKMYGVEIFYIPRRYMTKNTVIQEVIESKFEEAIPLEAYVDTFDGYEGQGSLLSKFGVQALDDLTLVISRDRFENYITPLIKNIPNIELATRPKEGDLIYFPLGDRLFEIKFVEHEKPFYQLKKNYVYELRCELYRYEDEVIDTGVGDIDDNLEKAGYIETLTLVSSGTTAVLTTGIVDGAIRQVTILNRGSDFTSLPRVAISSAPSAGLTAVGVASMRDDLVDYTGDKTSKIEKRPIIGKKAAHLSDKVILTSDNPRNENPKKIIEDMVRGVSPIDYKKIIKVTDREEAIMASERISQPGDIVLIAGKGHENFQEINGKKKPFDDYEIVKKYF